jgi:hypothetical protein
MLKDPPRGGVRSTRGLRPTMTARGQSTGISIGMLPQTLIVSRLDQLNATWRTNFVFSLLIKFSPVCGQRFFNRNNTLAKHSTYKSKYYTTEFDLEEGF